MFLSTVLNIRNRRTLYVAFKPSPTGHLPRRFCLIRKGNLGGSNMEPLEYERFLNGSTPRIKFNVVEGGEFTTNVPVEVIKDVPIEIPELNITMPPYERNREKRNIDIVTNPNLTGTPARIFTWEGIIEKSPIMSTYPKPMQKFFLLHEMGHQYYKTEAYCDLFATVHFLEMGYNMSTAIYCLTNVLKRNPANNERIIYIYNTLMKAKKQAA